MKTSTSSSLLAVAMLLAFPAQADIPSGPCDLAGPGDSCMTESDEPGTCVDDGGSLVCEPNGGAGGAGGAAAATAATTGAGATTGGGPAPTPETEDDGCAVSAPGKAGSPWSAGALALVALGAGLSLRRRR